MRLLQVIVPITEPEMSPELEKGVKPIAEAERACIIKVQGVSIDCDSKSSWIFPSLQSVTTVLGAPLATSLA
jgi:hypothetical protein